MPGGIDDELLGDARAAVGVPARAGPVLPHAAKISAAHTTPIRIIKCNGQTPSKLLGWIQNGRMRRSHLGQILESRQHLSGVLLHGARVRGIG